MNAPDGDLLAARDLSGCVHRLACDAAAPTAGPDSLDTAAQRRMDAAAAHRTQVRETLASMHTDHPEAWFIVDGPNRAARVQQTVDAVARRVRFIANATLPDRPDPAGSGRRGHVELLMLDGDQYRPVIVVNHRVTEPTVKPRPTSAVRTSPLWGWFPTPDPTRKVRSNSRDVTRLCHLAEMLMDLGWATDPVGGVIGMDADCIVVQDLSAAMGNYRDSYQLRRRVILGVEQTRPSRVYECRTCQWWAGCEQQLIAERDVSLVVNGAAAQQFRESGITTVDQLAAATDEGEHSVMARAWLRDIPLVRRTTEVTVHRADIEVDVDMESYLEAGAYLWGTLLTDNSDPAATPIYRPFVTWTPLPTDDEARSFAEFWGWLTTVRDDAARNGKTFAAYCYSQQAENRWLLGSARRFASYPGIPTEEQVREFITSDQWVDVFAAVSDSFISIHGKGLKRIAPVAGFHWRDDDAGGEASMDWYQLACGMSGDEPALDQQRRLLEYNEDDVWATKVLREWMSSPAVLREVPFSDDLPVAAP